MAGITGLGNYRSTAAFFAASTNNVKNSRVGDEGKESEDDSTKSEGTADNKTQNTDVKKEVPINGSYAGAETTNADLSVESFFRLMAAELANQDMSNPMSNSEMMTQMTQIAMMSAMQNFSKAMDEMEQANLITYGTSMMGKEVLMAKIDDKTGEVKKVSGVVTRVDIYNGEPLLYLDDNENNSYSLSNLMTIYEAGHGPSKDEEKPGDVEKPDAGGKPSEDDDKEVSDPDKTPGGDEK